MAPLPVPRRQVRSVEPDPAHGAATPAAHSAKIIEFPSTRADYGAVSPDLGIAEEFYIAAQPFPPQWDWEMGKK